MNLKRFATLSLGAWTAAAAMSGLASADITQVTNTAFAAKKISPYSGNAAFEFGPTSFTVLQKSFDVGSRKIFEQDVAGGPLRSILPFDLPNILGLTVKAGVSGSADLKFGYYVTGGRMDIAYPSHSTLNFQTSGLLNGMEAVRVNDRLTIGSQFAQGTQDYTVKTANLPLSAVGSGYFGQFLDVAQGAPPATQSWQYDKNPNFKVTSPYAEAWLHAGATIRGGITAKASALFGIASYENGLGVELSVGDSIVEISPDGLFIAGQRQGNFSLYDPINVPIPNVGTATISVPNIAATSLPAAPGSTGLTTGQLRKPILTVNADLEKLIPGIGQFLHNDWGPFEYTLFHQGGGPVVSLTQEMSFTPKPKVRLDFSEPVMVNDVIARSFTFDVGQQVSWTPLFSSQDVVKVAPTYILDNTFTSKFGIDVSVQTTVEALALTLKLPPLPDISLPPLFGPETVTVPLANTTLYANDFTVPFASVSGRRLEFRKTFNLDPNAPVVKLTGSSFNSGDQFGDGGTATWQVELTREVQGEPSRTFTHELTGRYRRLMFFPNTEFGGFNILESCEGDFVVVDPVTGEQFNLGPALTLSSDADFSSFLPQEGYSYLDTDHPEYGPLYLGYLDEPPDNDIDVANHPILGRFNGEGRNFSQVLESSPEFADLRDAPATTILARTREWTPVFDGKFLAFSQGTIAPALNDDGTAVFKGLADNFDTTSELYNLAVYRADGESLARLVRQDDPTPDGGMINIQESRIKSNNAGQIAFSTNAGTGEGVYRQGPDGLVQIASLTQQPPEGNGTFVTLHGVSGINNSGQVAFGATLEASGTFQFAVYRGDGANLTKIARTGDAAPGFATPIYSFYDSSLSDSGQVLLVAATQFDTQTGVFLGDGLTLTPLAVTGTPVPGGGTIAQLVAGKISDAGKVAFNALVNTPSSGQKQGIYKWDDGQIVEIALNSAGQFGALLYGPAINDRGDVAFASSQGIYVHTGGGLQPIVTQGQTTPDGASRFQGGGDFREWQVNNDGQVAFAYDVFDVTQGSNSGIYVHDGTNLVEVARTGRELAGSVIVELVMGDLNDEMQLAYSALLADGREVVARFEPVMVWHNRGSGDWADGANWSLHVPPSKPYDVIIVGEDSLSVAGPSQNSTVKSLSLGAGPNAVARLQLAEGVTLTAVNGTLIRENGILGGEGTLAGNLVNAAGVVSPGSSPGILAIDGNYVQGSLGLLLLEIAGPTPGSEHDVLDVTGAVALSGDVVLSFLNGYVPQPGTTLDLIRFGDGFDASQATFHVAGVPQGLQASAFTRDGTFGVQFAAVPEPASALLTLFALSCCLAAYRRRLPN